jgi:DNA-binding NarL/FixJ family response regulator
MKPPERIRVLIADANEVFRRQLVHTILGHPRLELLGVAENAGDALSLILSREPNVALIGLEPAEWDWLRAVQRLPTRRPGAATRLVLLCDVSRPVQIVDPLGLGCSGWVRRTLPYAEICRALVAAGRRETWVPNDPAWGLIEPVDPPPEA